MSSQYLFSTTVLIRYKNNIEVARYILERTAGL
jgi:hypothetical protein